MDDLALATTTDSAETATAAAENNEQGARVPEPEPKTEPKYEEPPNTKVESYEHPRSERTLLLERLQQYEAELAEAESETIVTTNEAAKAEEAPAGKPDSQPDDEVLTAIRQRAIDDAARDSRARMGLEPSAQAQLSQETARLLGSFQERFKAVAPPDLQKLVTAVQAQGVDIPPAAHDALISIPGGEQAFVHLLKNPEEIKRLTGMQGVARGRRQIRIRSAYCHLQSCGAPRPT